MSITFRVLEGPTRPMPDTDIDGEPMLHPNGLPVMYEDEIHALNVSNLNGAFMLEALGLDVDQNGYHEFKVDTLPELRRRLLRSLNGDVAKFERLQETTGGPGTGMCRVTTMGLSESQLRVRLEALLAIVVAAQELNKSVVYS